MAEADDASSTTDWIWLRKAWDLAVAAFGGSELLAEKRLRGWLGTGDLPWDCADEDWKAPDAAQIAELNRILAVPDDSSLVVYHKGDPRFFADGPEIDWKNSAAREASFVRVLAQADGVKVPHARLLELLSGGLREREEVPAPSATAPVAAPAPPRNVPEAELRQCLLDIVKERPPHTPPLVEEAAKNEVERRLGAPVSRARIRQALKDVAPHFKLRRGRPCKNAQ